MRYIATIVFSTIECLFLFIWYENGGPLVLDFPLLLVRGDSGRRFIQFPPLIVYDFFKFLNQCFNNT